ncbi:MAG TPA: PAS domain S-box protein [Verrucomicrobiae bacterium]|jgi:PAS domain S-box-containing protein
MNHSLRVLLIDDNPDDRLLALRALQKEVPNIKATEITNQQALERALTDGGFDLVITDYQIRWSDGLQILREVKRLWPNVPVVMFTGTGSEEIAVEAMKAGLDDYVIKSPRHFARLPAAAMNALRQSKMRLQKAEAESNFARLFETMPIGLFHMRPDGTILQVNSALATMLGFEHPADASGHHALEFFMTAEEHGTWRDKIERDGTLVGHETQIHRRDGSLMWVEISARALRDGISGTLFYEGSVEDISQRRAAQQERERLIAELRGALSHAKQLSGLLPICSSCKKIRDDHGEWNPMEVYIQQRSDASFTHSFCPECVRRLYPEIFAEESK